MAGSKTLTVTITGDASNVRRALRGVGDDVDDVDGKVGRAGQNWSGAMSGLAAAGSVAAVGIGAAAVGVGYLVNEAEQARKVGAETERVIRTTGASAWITADAVAALAEQTSRKTGIDDEAIQTTANWLLTFKNVRDVAGEGNDVFSQSVTLAQDMATVMGSDATDSATLLGKALNDPVRGLTSLTRAGVTFTDSQKEQVRALAESGDMLGAQKIILEEVASQFEGAAAAAASPWDFAKVEIGNVAEALGGELLPVISEVIGATTPLISQYGSNLAPVFQTLGDAIERLAPVFTDYLAGVGEFLPVVADLASAFMDALIPALEVLYDMVGDLLSELGPRLEPAMEDIGVAAEEFGVALAEILVALEPLIPIVADFIVHGAEMAATFAEITADVTGFLGTVSSLAPAVGLVSSAFGVSADTGKDAGSAMGEAALGMDTAAESAVGLEAPVGGAADALMTQAQAAEQAEEQLDAWTQAVQEAFGAQLDVVGATEAFEASIDKVTESIMLNGQTIDLNTEKGRQNSASLRKAAEDAIALAEAYAGQGKYEEAQTVLAGTRERIIEAGLAAGASREQMELYLATLGLTPEQIETTLSVLGIPENEAALEHVTRDRTTLAWARHTGTEAVERALNHAARQRESWIVVGLRYSGQAAAYAQGNVNVDYQDADGRAGRSVAPVRGRSTVGLFPSRDVVVQIDGREVGRTRAVAEGVRDSLIRDRRAVVGAR